MQAQVKHALGRFSEELDSYLRDLLRREGAFMADIAAYAFGWVDEHGAALEGRRGKGVRPAFTLLVHEALTGGYLSALPAAAAVELVHNYSLVHDDVEDRDEERRGRPTVWKLWGDAVAINVGSGLYTLAFQACHELPTTPDRALAAARALARASMRLSAGQQMDLNFEKTLDVTETAYREMIAGKTGALLECAVHLGALLATDDARVIQAYTEFGRLLGLAFQIRDDALDLWGDPARRGKAQYGDIVRKKKTLPMLYALRTLPEPERAQLRALYGDGSPMGETQVRLALALIEQAGARAYTEQVADDAIRQALVALDSTGVENDAQAALRALAVFLGGRDY